VSNPIVCLLRAMVAPEGGPVTQLCRKDTVLRQNAVPVVTDPAEAARRLELGMLSVMAHGEHQHELEAQLAYAFGKVAPEVIGNEYLVLGTVDQQTWKAGLAGAGQKLDEMLNHMADFKHVLKLEVDPGGWRPAEPSKARGKRYAGGRARRA
jgi:hypothetical protein